MNFPATFRPNFQKVVLTLLVMCVLSNPIAAAQSTTPNDAVKQENANISVELTAETESVSQGENITINVSIENIGNGLSPAPVFNLSTLPQGWAVVSWSGTNATYRSSTNEWLWTAIDSGSTEQFSITLETPSQTTNESLSGEVVDGYDNRDADKVNVTVTDEGSQHESGVSNTLFNAVAGSDDKIQRDEILSFVTAYISESSGGNPMINGVAFNRSDFLNLIRYYIEEGG